MIKLERVRFQTSEQIFPTTVKKGLRISLCSYSLYEEHVVRSSKMAGKLINENCIEWEENFYVPVLYNKEMSFQIYNVHKFGYNPQQLEIIFFGKIIVESPEQTHSAWEVYNHKNQRIGFLSANITAIKSVRPEGQVKKKQQIFDTYPKMVYFKSLVIHLPYAQNKTVYAEVNIGGNKARTINRRSQSGQLVFLQEINLFKEKTVYEAVINVYDAEDKQLLGTGKYTLVGQKPQKKVAMMKDYQRVGEMFVEAVLVKKDDKRNKGYLSYFVPKIIAKSRESSEEDIKKSRVNSLIQQISSTPQSFRQLEGKQVPRYKKISTVEKNSQIAFGKEKRFRENLLNTNQVSYLKNRSFEFKTPNSKFYKGASMGFGRKADFTRGAKQNPGVGSYNLPSLFDKH